MPTSTARRMNNNCARETFGSQVGRALLHGGEGGGHRQHYSSPRARRPPRTDARPPPAPHTLCRHVGVRGLPAAYIFPDIFAVSVALLAPPLAGVPWLRSIRRHPRTALFVGGGGGIFH